VCYFLFLAWSGSFAYRDVGKGRELGAEALKIKVQCVYCPAIFYFWDWMMEEHFAKIIAAVGEDLNREGLIDTPKRAAKAFKFLTNGYEKTLDEVLNDAIFTADTEDMVIVKDIELYSLCEHHLLPFIGKCHVGYLPKGKVLGLSKVARVIDMYARRLQIQEKLTKQIADAIELATGARGVAVVIEAKHLCMMMRGVEKQNSIMTTSVMTGIFRKEISTRSEFLNLINRQT
jgi:GTP cyclohydrolase I